MRRDPQGTALHRRARDDARPARPTASRERLAVQAGRDRRSATRPSSGRTSAAARCRCGSRASISCCRTTAGITASRCGRSRRASSARRSRSAAISSGAPWPSSRTGTAGCTPPSTTSTSRSGRPGSTTRSRCGAARGALRLWLGFADRTLTELTASVVLDDVAGRFAPELPLLEMQVDARAVRREEDHAASS